MSVLLLITADLFLRIQNHYPNVIALLGLLFSPEINGVLVVLYLSYLAVVAKCSIIALIVSSRKNQLADKAESLEDPPCR